MASPKLSVARSRKEEARNRECVSKSRERLQSDSNLLEDLGRIILLFLSVEPGLDTPVPSGAKQMKAVHERAQVEAVDI